MALCLLAFLLVLTVNGASGGSPHRQDKERQALIDNGGQQSRRPSMQTTNSGRTPQHTQPTSSLNRPKGIMGQAQANSQQQLGNIRNMGNDQPPSISGPSRPSNAQESRGTVKRKAQFATATERPLSSPKKKDDPTIPIRFDVALYIKYFTGAESVFSDSTTFTLDVHRGERVSKVLDRAIKEAKKLKKISGNFYVYMNRFGINDSVWIEVSKKATVADYLPTEDKSSTTIPVVSFRADMLETGSTLYGPALF